MQLNISFGTIVSLFHFIQKISIGKHSFGHISTMAYHIKLLLIFALSVKLNISFGTIVSLIQFIQKISIGKHSFGNISVMAYCIKLLLILTWSVKHNISFGTIVSLIQFIQKISIGKHSFGCNGLYLCNGQWNLLYWIALLILENTLGQWNLTAFIWKPLAPSLIQFIQKISIGKHYSNSKKFKYLWHPL